ncbi:immediate early response gene 2 protein [Lissotriton helveticus]
MEVQKEAQRIMTLSVWKMYHSRVQRGGMRLHRSLQLSLVMRSAREVYLSARLEDDQEENGEACAPAADEPAVTEEQKCAPAAVTPACEMYEENCTPSSLPQREEGTYTMSPGTVSIPPGSPNPGDSAPGLLTTRHDDAGNYPQVVEPEPAMSEPMEEDETVSASPATARLARPNRKRRSCTLSRRGAAEEAELVPSKKARLGDEHEAPPQPQEGAFPSLAKVLQSGIGAVLGSTPPGGCRAGGGGAFSIVVRAVVAF